MRKFTQSQQNYIAEGKNQDDQMRKFVREVTIPDDTKAVSKRHALFSGPPGVGKTYSIMDEMRKANVKYVAFGGDSTESAMTAKIAFNIMKLKPNEEIVLLFDDADDAIFGDQTMLNRWKLALQKDGPVFRREVQMIGERAKWEKRMKTGDPVIAQQCKDMIQAIDFYTEPGSVGMCIPMDQARVFVICNLNIRDPKSFPSKRIAEASKPVIDRFKARRLNFDWRVSWGWMAYTLLNSQPFPNFPLDDDQKRKILDWMWSNWNNITIPSYRTVEEMAEYLLNDPENYEDTWESGFLINNIDNE